MALPTITGSGNLDVQYYLTTIILRAEIAPSTCRLYQYIPAGTPIPLKPIVCNPGCIGSSITVAMAPPPSL
ncbi:MAG TPA: hypothetical protein VHI13_07730 [Candidatus Kapabacteria bacterium]|nr:hypothetical protein [Candidatus Kapabacteria bacterium]